MDDLDVDDWEFDDWEEEEAFDADVYDHSELDMIHDVEVASYDETVEDGPFSDPTSTPGGRTGVGGGPMGWSA